MRDIPHHVFKVSASVVPFLQTLASFGLSCAFAHEEILLLPVNPEADYTYLQGSRTYLC